MSIARITDDNVTFDEKALAAERQRLRSNPDPNRASDPATRVNRRTILRGTAAAIALPALESLTRPRRAYAQAIPAKPALRFVGWHIGCGVWGPSWFPTDFGTDYTLSPSLAALQPVKGKVAVISGVQNTPACNPTGSHGCGPSAMLTCRQGTKPGISMGISVDQVYAQALGMTTRIPSLQLSVTDKTFADVQYPAVYNGTVSWANATEPLRPVVKPELVFDRLFMGVAPTGNTAAATEAAKRRALRTSVLDHVMGEARALHPKLGTTDRRKLDQYLTSVRAVEVEVQRVATTPTSCSPGTMIRPTVTTADVPALTKVMLDLMVLAFQCDATRVITFMQGNGGNTSFARCPWLNITEDHHGLSHHQRDPGKTTKLAAIDKWEVEQFAYFLTKLDAVTEEGGKTALDNSVIFFSSEISDGNAHNQTNKPILLAGSAGGKIVSGRHVQFPGAAQPDLFIALLNILGVQATTFGTAGTKPLAGLT